MRLRRWPLSSNLSVNIMEKLNVILFKKYILHVYIFSLTDHHALFHSLGSRKVSYPLKLSCASREDFWFELQGMQWRHYGRIVYGRNSTTLSIFFPFLSHILVVGSYEASNHFLKVLANSVFISISLYSTCTKDESHSLHLNANYWR